MLGYLSLNMIHLPMLNIRHMGHSSAPWDPDYWSKSWECCCSLLLKAQSSVCFSKQICPQTNEHIYATNGGYCLFHSSMANQIYSFKTEHSMYLLKDFHKMENRTKATYKTSSTQTSNTNYYCPVCLSKQGFLAK